MSEEISSEQPPSSDSDKLTALVKLALHQSGHVSATAHFAKSIVLFIAGFALLAISATISVISAIAGNTDVGIVTLVLGGLLAIIIWLYAWDSFSTGNRGLTRDESRSDEN